LHSVVICSINIH